LNTVAHSESKGERRGGTSKSEKGLWILQRMFQGSHKHYQITWQHITCTLSPCKSRTYYSMPKQG